MGNEKFRIVAIWIIIAAVLAAGGFYAYRKYSSPEPAKEKPATLGGELFEKTNNPGEKIPSTNPYEAKTNPFEEAKTNPFKDVYKNPFR